MSLAPAAPSVFVADTPRTGRGLFTSCGLGKGELAFILEGDEHYQPSESREDALAHPNWVGIGEHRWIDPAYPWCFLNHSCEPNLGIRGAREFVALERIAAGEELTFDYSITEHDERWEMDCSCGAASCRGIVQSIQFLPRSAFELYLPHVNPFFARVYRASRNQRWSAR